MCVCNTWSMLGFALALHSGINCSWQGVGEAYGMLGLNQDSHVQGEQHCLLTIALVPMPSTLTLAMLWSQTVKMDFWPTVSFCQELKMLIPCKRKSE